MKRSIFTFCLILVSSMLIINCSDGNILGGETIPTSEFPEITNPDLIGTRKCSPPCWNGFVPGATTLGEASAVLEEQFAEITDNNTYFNITGNETYGKSIVISRSRYDIVEMFFSEEEILKYVLITFPEEILLGSIIAEWGPPDTYIVFYVDVYQICINYYAFGMQFCPGETGSDTVSEQTEVDYVYFFDSHPASEFQPSHSGGYTRPWTGYEDVRLGP